MYIIKRTLSLFILLATFGLSTAVHAEATLSERDLKDIAKMEEYLNGITTMSVNFTQSQGSTPDIPTTH